MTAIASEHLLVPCPTCENRGMVNGERCTTCNGQGHIRRELTIVADEPVAEERPAPKTKKDARAWLADHGIDAPAKASLPELLAAVAAEAQRLVDADTAASSDERTPEGDETPARDPAAPGAGEAGEPS